MGCEEIQEALDAYALGALTTAEARVIEGHVGDCPDCQRYLDRAVQVVGLLPLAVPLRSASPRLRHRILAQAARQASLQTAGRWRRFLPVVLPLAAALVLAVAAGSLAWSVRLQGRADALHRETAALQRQLRFLDAQQADMTGTLVSLSDQFGVYDQMLDEQRAVFTVLASPDVRSVPMVGKGPGKGASGVYFWSRWSGAGGLVCNLPPLPRGKAYHLWLLRDGQAFSGGSFSSWNGLGLHAINFRELGLDGGFTAFGVTIEDAVSPPRAPTSEFILYAENITS